MPYYSWYYYFFYPFFLFFFSFFIFYCWVPSFTLRFCYCIVDCTSFVMKMKKFHDYCDYFNENVFIIIIILNLIFTGVFLIESMH